MSDDYLDVNWACRGCGRSLSGVKGDRAGGEGCVPDGGWVGNKWMGERCFIPVGFLLIWDDVEVL